MNFLSYQLYGSPKYMLNLHRSLLEKHCYNLYKKDLKHHFGCINSLDFSSDGELLVSGGDDKRVLLWNCCVMVHSSKLQPTCMKTSHLSNIFCTKFDCCNENIFSSGNDEQVIQHNVLRQDSVRIFSYSEPVYCVDTPFDNQCLFVTAGEDGTVQLCDTRSATTRVIVANSDGSFHASAFHPRESSLVATANSLDGIALWDIRLPEKALLHTRVSKNPSSIGAMSVRFNYTGDKVLALMRKLGPVLFDVGNGSLLSQHFKDDGFSNECTMKNACFAGDKDQYIVSGSDDFNIYIWRVPDSSLNNKISDSAHLILRGHRSIVNQVRYNQHLQLLASAGVEKIVKVWCPFPMKECTGDITNDDYFIPRPHYKHAEYSRFIAEAGLMSHDYEQENTDEDTRMLAFFDSMIDCVHTRGHDDIDTERHSSLLDLLLHETNSTSSSSSIDDDHSNSVNESDHTFGVSELRRIFQSSSSPANEVDETTDDSNPAKRTINLDLTSSEVGTSTDLVRTVESDATNCLFGSSDDSEDHSEFTPSEEFRKSCNHRKRNYRKR